MSKLMQLIAAAEEAKPPIDTPCNQCGWCCLTEVCAIGVELVGSVIPCKLLRAGGDGKHYCNLMKIKAPGVKSALAIGTGCDAETQTEALLKFREAHDEERADKP